MSGHDEMGWDALGRKEAPRLDDSWLQACSSASKRSKSWSVSPATSSPSAARVERMRARASSSAPSAPWPCFARLIRGVCRIRVWSCLIRGGWLRSPGAKSAQRGVPCQGAARQGRAELDQPRRLSARAVHAVPRVHEKRGGLLLHQGLFLSQSRVRAEACGDLGSSVGSASHVISRA